MSTQENNDFVAGGFSSPPVGSDDRAPLALAAGLVASIVAGGIWGLLVYLTNMEIGYAAWGVGLLVGVAMSQATATRSRSLAVAAAAFAILGLAVGKTVAFKTAAGSITDEIQADAELMVGAVAWQMYDGGELDPATIEAIDATQEAGDTLSDALWAEMQAQANARLALMTADDREETAAFLAGGIVEGTGPVEAILAQMSGFDLLWLFLAVGTAFQMMSPGKPEKAEAAASV